jgi:hypothetical protein
MSASQRVSRGFHRLAVFLAAIPFLFGIVLSAVYALDGADTAKVVHDHAAKFQSSLICARDAMARGKDATLPNGEPNFVAMFVPADRDDYQIDLKAIGCSERAHKVAVREVRDAAPINEFDYTLDYLRRFGIYLALTCGVTLFVYGLVRAIGWVIGGFAAS